MERYCIKEYAGELSCEHMIEEENRQGIQINEFVLYEVAKTKKEVFPECRKEIVWLSGRKDGIHTDLEEEMYQSILNTCYGSNVMTLDIYLRLYYTVLYEKNKNIYVPLVEDSWTAEKREEIRKKRKEYNRSVGKDIKREMPFQIVEKENSSSTGGRPNEATKIIDFAPGISRLAYLSTEFRNIFKPTKKICSKYSYSEIQKIFDYNNVSIKRKEEIWLIERLLGVNLAWAFYSLFSVLLKGVNFKELEEDLEFPSNTGQEGTVSTVSGYMKSIIHEIMAWEGVYSRTELVIRLKIIVELKIRSEKEGKWNKPEKILQYLYERIVKQRMGALASAYKEKENSIYCKFKESADKEKIFEKLKDICDSAIKEYFSDSGNYCLLKDIDKLVNTGNTEKSQCEETIQEKEGEEENTKQEKEGEKEFNEKMYELIQKIVISEQIK